MLASLSSFLEEIFSAIGKYKNERGQESVYTMAFLSLVGGTLFFIATVLFTSEVFVFSGASLPTFIPRVALSIVQEYITIRAIVEASRSTFTFIRISTIPLLLAVDMLLGYTLSYMQLTGLGILFATMWYLFGKETLDKKGLYFVIWSAINAVIVISLFKYNITYYNSVAAEQIILSLFLMICFFVAAITIAKEQPLAFLKKPIFVFQALVQGAAGTLNSFAYVFAPASVIIAATRSSAMFWSITSGGMYFGEKKLTQKIVGACFLALGTFLLVF